ncbi:MAG: FAD-binding protein [Candidatus Thermoplasmatota archaeon]|nr:FAD-binding protein [Candidatus Thermoplasmatota archaeon]
MQAWDVVIIGGSVAGLRAAIAASDEGATVTVLSSSAPSSFADDAVNCGLATSSGETNPSVHATDTQRIGADLCEQDVVSASTHSAIGHLGELERWGLNLRRDRNGSPHLGKLPGQTNARTANTGDSTLREVRTILEEQCIKRNIPRRGDIEILDLVLNGNRASGIVALDVQSGEVFGIQAKSVLLAGSGFQSAWNGDGIAMGSAAALALRSGIPLADLEFTSMHPLTVADTSLTLPLDLLGAGGKVIGPDGQPLSTEDGPDSLAHTIITGGGASLDLTEISGSDFTWFKGVANSLSSRCGIDCTKESIPLMPIAGTTIGGLPTDASGNVVNGSWDSTLKGLFAAGDAACSGLHGASINSGDHLLGSLTSGSIAGTSAASFASTSKHTSSNQISVALSEALHLHDSILTDAGADGTSPGEVQSSLANTMRTHMGPSRDASGMTRAAQMITELQETKLTIGDTSPVMNTEMVSMLRTEGLLVVASAAVSAALAREESRGTHIRTDFPETDDKQANHSLSSNDGIVATLNLRN